jgi:hypothetical protein
LRSGYVAGFILIFLAASVYVAMNGLPSGGDNPPPPPPTIPVSVVAIFKDLFGNNWFCQDLNVTCMETGESVITVSSSNRVDQPHLKFSAGYTYSIFAQSWFNGKLQYSMQVALKMPADLDHNYVVYCGVVPIRGSGLRIDTIELRLWGAW